MYIKIEGILTASTGPFTVAISTGENIQSLTLPAHIMQIEIAPDLLGKVSVMGNTLSLQGKTAIHIYVSETFNRAEVVKLDEKMTEVFFASLNTDPDVKKINTRLQEMLKEFLQDTKRILDFMPDEGYTSNAVFLLEKIDWKGVLQEVTVAGKKAFPEGKTSLISKYFPEVSSFL